MTIEHISFSQYSSYTQCPRSWYLSKIARAEERQTWFFPVGTAVHSMIEDYLDPDTGDGLRVSYPDRAQNYFYPLIEKQMQIEPDLSQWLSGGSQADPTVGDKALQQVKDCFERALEYLADIDVWEVEYDASGRLPGLDVPIKAYVDIVGEHKKHGPVILDWKTGSSKPKNNFQLETYAALLQDHVFANDDEVYTFNGLWAMLKPGVSKARKIDLSKVDPAEVGAKYQAVYEQMMGKLYQTKSDYFKCKFCFHQDNCLLNAGPTDRAKYYDKGHIDGLPY